MSRARIQQDDRVYQFGREIDKRVAMRFFPDRTGKSHVALFKHASKNQDTDKLYASWVGPDAENPFEKKFISLFNEGKKEEAKKYSKRRTYLANVIVINDSSNPENNGKTFILEMSPGLFKKLGGLVLNSKFPEFSNKSILENSFTIVRKRNGFGLVDYSVTSYDGPGVEKIYFDIHNLNEGFEKTKEELEEDLEWFDKKEPEKYQFY